MKRVISGIKPTGNLTLGNYIGALKNFAKYQDENDAYIFIADIHALTLPIDPDFLKNNIIDILAFYLASGLDPKKTTIFRQSDIGEVTELNSILINYIFIGELSRMTQYKDICSRLQDKEIGVGVFAYPVLMAADLFMYEADIVPVGEDQVQHVELARDIAKRFNHRYGEILHMPKTEVSKIGKRIMSLSDPAKKMSKSDIKGDIFLKDDISIIRKKIMSAVTDSEAVVRYDVVNKPGISNLLTIYAALDECSIEEAELLFKDANYGSFKKGVADKVIEVIEPFQNRYKRYAADLPYLRLVLEEGQVKAKKLASKILSDVKSAVGLSKI